MSRSEFLADDAVRLEEVSGVLDGARRIESLARVDIDAEERIWVIPGVEVRARRFPMDPTGPAVPLGMMGYRCQERAHAAHLRKPGQVLLDLSRTDRICAGALDHEALAVDRWSQIRHVRGWVHHVVSITCSNDNPIDPPERK